MTSVVLQEQNPPDHSSRHRTETPWSDTEPSRKIIKVGNRFPHPPLFVGRTNPIGFQKGALPKIALKTSIYREACMHLLIKALGMTALLSLVAALTPTAAGQTILGIPIGAGQATFDFSDVNADGNLDAFVPTGSDSSICLVTLGGRTRISSGPRRPFVLRGHCMGRKVFASSSSSRTSRHFLAT